MRLKVSHDMPGVESERVTPTKYEAEEAIYQGGEYIGTVVYVKRKVKSGIEGAKASVYGWRPEGWGYAKNAKLTTKQDAIKRLKRYQP